jgi:hypothetical protein
MLIEVQTKIPGKKFQKGRTYTFWFLQYRFSYQTGQEETTLRWTNKTQICILLVAGWEAVISKIRLRKKPRKHNTRHSWNMDTREACVKIHLWRLTTLQVLSMRESLLLTLRYHKPASWLWSFQRVGKWQHSYGWQQDSRSIDVLYTAKNILRLGGPFVKFVSYRSTSRTTFDECQC